MLPTDFVQITTASGNEHSIATQHIVYVSWLVADDGVGYARVRMITNDYWTLSPESTKLLASIFNKASHL